MAKSKKQNASLTVDQVFGWIAVFLIVAATIITVTWASNNGEFDFATQVAEEDAIVIVDESEPATDDNIVDDDITTDEAAVVVDPTSNWKTYTDNEYDFTIKYPETWTYAIDKDEYGNKKEIEFSVGMKITCPLVETGYEIWVNAKNETIGKASRRILVPVAEVEDDTDNIYLALWREDDYYSSCQMFYAYANDNDPMVETLDDMLKSLKLL